LLQSTKNAELQRKRVLQELGSMLRVQHHPHAVRLLNAFEDDKGYQVIMPLLKGGNPLTLS
jgi:serine/threonine protein kinase